MLLVTVGLFVKRSALVLVDGFGKEIPPETKPVFFEAVQVKDARFGFRCSVCGAVMDAQPSYDPAEIERRLQPHADKHQTELWG